MEHLLAWVNSRWQSYKYYHFVLDHKGQYCQNLVEKRTKVISQLTLEFVRQSVIPAEAPAITQKLFFDVTEAWLIAVWQKHLFLNNNILYDVDSKLRCFQYEYATDNTAYQCGINDKSAYWSLHTSHFSECVEASYRRIQAW